MKAVQGEKCEPSFIDKTLARDGYRLQQTRQPDSPNRMNNLWEPAPGNWGAHGRFDERAKSTSVEWRLRRAAGPRFEWIKLAAAGIAGVMLGALAVRANGNGSGT